MISGQSVGSQRRMGEGRCSAEQWRDTDYLLCVGEVSIAKDRYVNIYK